MQFLRTSAAQFSNLPDFPYEAHYLEMMEARLHYVDEGSGDEIILCLHGEPTWAFLYRKMIAPLSKKYRVIVPDLFGFGRSDKPTEIEDHSYDFHYESLVNVLDMLDLQNITLVCQDWG
ncbi:MAG: alpha/beta fold hydrolase, partial [Aggregatilineales bacterium]